MRIHSGLYYRFILCPSPPKPIINLAKKAHLNCQKSCQYSWMIMKYHEYQHFTCFFAIPMIFLSRGIFLRWPKTVWFFIFKTNNFLASGMCQVPSLKIHQNREQKFSSSFSPILYQFMNYNQGSTDRLVRGPTGPNRSEILKFFLVLVRSQA